MSENTVSGGGAVRYRTRRWVWALLTVSLAFNLLVVGVIGGSIWAVRKGGFWDAPLVIGRYHHFMKQLPADRRRDMRRIFRAHKPRIQPYWRAVRQARVEVGRLIARGGHSQAELDAALDTLFDRERAARAAMKPKIAEMLAALAPDERAVFLSVYMPYLDEIDTRAAGQ